MLTCVMGLGSVTPPSQNLPVSLYVNVWHGKESHDFTDLHVLPLSHPMLTYVMGGPKKGAITLQTLYVCKDNGIFAKFTDWQTRFLLDCKP